jgi:streptogramin lyase
MRFTTRVMLSALLALVCAISWPVARAQQVVAGLQVDKTSVGGIVVNENGAKPEAGVWVIAETKSLTVPFRKIVVTDDKGRFLVPDLPDGAYKLWVRGYGLKDSERVDAALGGQVKLQVANASTPQEAAKIYPASYWTSLIHPPAKDQLPKGYATQEQWLAALRGGCNQCHQIGMVATRRHTDVDDWDGIFQRNQGMGQAANRLGKELLEKTLADWATRIQAGEVPPSPPRPAGMERNFVVTQWDWGTNESFFHDVTVTDKRNPTLYPYGKVYGADRTGGVLWVLDPVKNTIEGLQVQPRNAKGYNAKVDYYHDRETADSWMASPHNPMLDEKGRVWMTEPVRPPGVENNPKWSASTIAMDTTDPAAMDVAAKALLSRSHAMQLGYYDTKTNKFVGVDTSYNTHHLQFDWQGRIWTDGDVLGELDTTKIDPANPEGTEAAAQHAWMRVDLDTKKVVPTNGYATAVSPIDGTVWLSVPEVNGPQNKLYMLDPKTSKYKDYPLPLPGRLSHGIDFSTDGMVWFSAGSGHLGRLDPKTGKFKYWDLPGPKFTGTGMETGSTEYPYFLWVDQFNTFGLGKDTVIVTGTTSDSMLIFDPKKETFSVFRMPYPIPFYTRGLDGRIDDEKAGWKGRGIWATYSSYLPKFTETRIGSVNHIQIRPSPLAN